MKKIAIILSLLCLISFLTITNLESIFAYKPNNIDLNGQEKASSILSKEDALKLLQSINPNLAYEYKGDETNFPVLKDKGLYGYVFLPDIDTDLGYFIDKNNSHIYYFHPSGYLELIK